jgi:hypothetical protein
MWFKNICSCKNSTGFLRNLMPFMSKEGGSGSVFSLLCIRITFNVKLSLDLQIITSYGVLQKGTL